MRMAITAGSCIMLAVLAAPVRAVLLDVSPVLTVALDVDSFSVDIRASGVPTDEVITGFNLLLGYDATKLVPRPVIFSGALGSLAVDCNPISEVCAVPSSVLDFDPVAHAPPGYTDYLGQSTVAVQFENLSFSFDPIADLKPLQSPEPFALATIWFDILPTGGIRSETLLELMNDSAYTVPENSGGNFDVKGIEEPNILTSTTQNGSALIPVPTTLLLMLAPLCVVLFRRRGFARRDHIHA